MPKLTATRKVDTFKTLQPMNWVTDTIYATPGNKILDA